MYSENLLKETEKEMTDIVKKKKLDYIRNVAYAEKILL